jgi:hypothetical protein
VGTARKSHPITQLCWIRLASTSAESRSGERIRQAIAADRGRWRIADGADGVERDARLLEKGRLRAHILRMGRSIAIVVAGGLIALAIMVTNHWEINTSSAGQNFRLNRWTGSIEVCSVDPKTIVGSSFAGAKVDCIGHE